MTEAADPNAAPATSESSKRLENLATGKTTIEQDVATQAAKPKTIPPTVGRVVFFFLKDKTIRSDVEVYDYSKPLDAHITYVWSDTCVNVAGFDHAGNPFKATSVPINTGGAEAGSSMWAEWMPYQIGQAAKHAAA